MTAQASIKEADVLAANIRYRNETWQALQSNPLLLKLNESVNFKEEIDGWECSVKKIINDRHIAVWEDRRGELPPFDVCPPE